jgi:hypothetical protein
LILRSADFRGPGAALVCAAEEVISMRKLLFAVILATLLVLVLSIGVGAEGSVSCCS